MSYDEPTVGKLDQWEREYTIMSRYDLCSFETKKVLRNDESILERIHCLWNELGYINITEIHVNFL